ncbi:MAG: DUF2007 domain-containing protein [Hyphomicrobiales bacterium]
MTIKNFKLVFTGSNLEANYIDNILKENEITALVRNTLEESVIAGWASGTPEDSTRVFVNPEDFEKATKLITQYFNSKDKE